MISLKKNDKIIILVAFIILIIAGVAIAMYQSPEPEEYNPFTTTSEQSFDINWTVENGSIDSISDFAEKKSIYEKVVQIEDSNVISITFNLSWTDDRMTFLKRMGLDRFTLEITTPDGRTESSTITSAPITGQGTIIISMSSEIIPPESQYNSIKAKDAKDAKAKLKLAPYTQDVWTNKDIKINIGVKIGEIRIIKQIRDKGNDFDLEITYTYYKSVLQADTTKNTGEDNGFPPEDEVEEVISEYNSPYMSMIINTGCGRYV